MSDNTETAILAGGCFWGVQELLRHRDGVISTRVGYTGGSNENSTDRNHPGNAEAVEIVFDPERISYRDILEFFFQIHDPTTKDRGRLRHDGAPRVAHRPGGPLADVDAQRGVCGDRDPREPGLEDVVVGLAGGVYLGHGR